jgi:glycosyltransferase involved in cell wall biosynthesis
LAYPSLITRVSGNQVKPGFDLIHVNEATLLSLGILAKWFFKLPLVVHVRSVQRSGNHWRSRFFSYLLRKYADEVICIDETVRRSLPVDLPCVVIHNGLILGETDAASKQGHSPITLGYVGSLLRLKGIYELLEAVRILALERGLKFKLLIFGENVRDLAGFRACALKCMGFCDDVEKDVKDFISRHALQDVIELRGFAPDVRDIYPLLDVLCFPSHLNAAGRPVFEAAFFGIPSLVAMDSPLDDAAQHEITALVIDRPTPQLIADALERLIRDDVLREELGCNARLWAQRYFDMGQNAEELYRVYRKILDR